MNAATKWFGRVVVVGIVVSLVFALAAIFAPDQLTISLGTEQVLFAYLWLANIGQLLLALSLFSMPVARSPERAPVYAWLVALQRLATGVYWLLIVEAARDGGVFRPFMTLNLALGLILTLLAVFGFPAEARPTWTNVKAALRREWPARGALRWFGIVVLVGIAVNLVFALQALFAQQLLVGALTPGRVLLAPIWLAYTGLLLLVVSLFYLPVGLAPARYPVFAWLSVVSRLIAVSLWISLFLQPDGSVVLSFLITDSVFGLLQLVLLSLGAAPEWKPTPANLGRALTFLLGRLTLAGSPLPKRIAAVALTVLVVIVATVLWANLGRVRPDETFEDPAEHFKYGAIGLSPASRVPLYLFQAMPTVCAHYLKDPAKGWANFGFIFEEGRELPVGFARRDIGFPSLEPNCGLCHTGSYRTSPEAAPVVVPGAPAHELDLQGFQWFLYDCVEDPAFTADNLLAEIEKQNDLSWVQEQVYRYAIIPTAKTGLLMQRDDYQWQLRRPQQGRGRTDTFNPTKLVVFHLPDDRTIGTTDLPQTWNQKPRVDMWLHWDGNNNQITERNLAAAMAVGATPKSVVLPSFERDTDFLFELPPPKYPFPIDAERAARGQAVYDANCAGCHAFGSAKVGQVTPIAEVGTDRHRLDSFSAELVEDLHEIDESPFAFAAYRKTEGYSNVPIDGIWMRAPYLHHGAVPTLWDLLQAPENRPRVFYRGYNVYDPEKVGFVTSGPEAEKAGFRYDTAVPGNGNSGHLYGTSLPEEEKRDLLEYLKTL